MRKIPVNLRVMLLGAEKQITNRIRNELNPARNGDLTLELDPKSEEYKFCYKWIVSILKEATNFLDESYSYKSDIGPLRGVFPCEVKDNYVSFSIDYYDKTKKSWKDWFYTEV